MYFKGINKSAIFQTYNCNMARTSYFLARRWWWWVLLYYT